MRYHIALSTAALGCAVTAAPQVAFAQRTNDNVVTSSGDAFGRAIGSERIGLYSTEDVRGFSPIEAGNARIEGLYFVQADRPGARTVEGSAIRVGISAQGYPFPAPTGIVDYRLTLTGRESSLSATGAVQAIGPSFVNSEGKWAVSDQFGVYGGFGRGWVNRAEGGHHRIFILGGSTVWRPRDGAMVALFGGYGGVDDEEATPVFFPASGSLPPRIKRGRFLGQPWTGRSSRAATSGLIVKLPFGDWRVEGGLFDSRRKVKAAYADLFTGVSSDGRVANRTVIADGNNDDDSLSGELKLVRRIATTARLLHTLTASARGRMLDRDFGGTQRIGLGRSTVLAPDFRAAPVISLGPEDKDRVRQFTLGLAYDVKLADKASLDVSLSRSQYRKTVDFANLATDTLNVRDNPWLGNVSGTVRLSKRLTVYGGYVRGLEEAVIAPDIAVNRSEAPPAILTSQRDAGIRYAITPQLTFVGGAFLVRKPYFNIDSALRFRRLGNITNKGVELSLSGSLKPGLTLVAGSLFLDPRVSGVDVDAGRIGSRPIGSITRRTILNMDWRLRGGKSRWSFDFALESLSRRTGNAANNIAAPPRETLNLSTRYRFTIGSAKALLRAQVQNATNDYGWQVSQSGGFTYSNPRNFSLELVVDL